VLADHEPVPSSADQELVVAHVSAHPLRVGQHPVGLMDRRQRRTGVQLADLAEVPVEQRLLHRLGTEQVERHREDLAVQQDVVVAGDDRLQLRLRPGRRIVPQERVQDGHEVALAGAERARQERAPAHSGGHRLSDQPHGPVEGVRE
jgi:hypothetical protein